MSLTAIAFCQPASYFTILYHSLRVVSKLMFLLIISVSFFTSVPSFNTFFSFFIIEQFAVSSYALQEKRQDDVPENQTGEFRFSRG